MSAGNISQFHHKRLLYYTFQEQHSLVVCYNIILEVYIQLESPNYAYHLN